MAKENKSVIACAVHPGVVHTDLGRHKDYFDLFWEILMWFALNANEGAATQLFAATHPNTTLLAGQYLTPMARVITPEPVAFDTKLRFRAGVEMDEIIRDWENFRSPPNDKLEENEAASS